MYCKRILILQQTDPRFAERGKELCGMVKLVNEGQTFVTVFVTNARSDTFGEWWVLLNFDGEVFARNLETLNNDTFTFPLQNLDNVGCLLVKKEQDVAEVAAAQFGHKNLCATLRRNAKTLIEENSVSTPYEQFVATTQNFYEGVDIEQLKLNASSHYKSIAEYSSAFERYYAGNADTDYYKSVQKEISKVFVDFPPYYPLIKKYPQSFFVRIDFPSSEKYFVLGVLQQNDKVRYICYGLPVDKEELSDKDFVFVSNEPTSFWMLFQDATTGQITTLPQAV